MSHSPGEADELLGEIRRKAAGRSDGTGSFEVIREAGPWRMVLRLGDADRLGVLLEELHATRQVGIPEPSGLENRSRRLLAEVTALGDRLALIELEPAQGRAMLRSATPRLLPESIEYDEAILEDDRLSIRRYRCTRHGGTRRTVPANLGTEAIPRLVQELQRALDP